jgi:hypothetical protein
MYEVSQYKEATGRVIQKPERKSTQQGQIKDNRKGNIISNMSLQFSKKAFSCNKINHNGKKEGKIKDITCNVIQNVLITDIPQNKDFSNITDLGLWWAMAAEYHLQDSLKINGQTVNPLSFIHSLTDYLQGPTPNQINVVHNDRVRMLTHGYNPNNTPGKHCIVVNNQLVEVNSIIDNINKSIASNSVTPLYCYMGNNPKHKNLIKGIGEGPMLSPSKSSVSLDENNPTMSIQIALTNAGKANTWSEIINDNGSWKPINSVKGLDVLFNAYKISAQQKGSQDPQTIDCLKLLLTEVYKVVDKAYNDFANYLKNQKLITGEGPTLW